MLSDRLYIQLGSSCNCDCIFCAVADSRHFPELSLKRIREHLLVGRSNGLSKLTISGGEPTTRKDLRLIVRTARELGYMHIQVQTNGRALAKFSYTKNLLDDGVDVFLPSIHGHTAEIHDAIMRAPGAFVQTVQGIRNLVELQSTPVNTNTVITRQNYRHMPELVSLLIDLGVKQIQLSYVQAEGNAKNIIVDIGPAMTDAKSYINDAINACSELEVKILIDGIPQCILSDNYQLARNMRRAPVVCGVSDQDQLRLATKPGKLKRKDCTDCDLTMFCGGVWEKYIDLFGWNEFMPVR